MTQRGRKSTAALAIVDESKAGLSPIMAPAGLSDAERGVWLGTVNSKPANWFGTEHVPILVEYVRHVCRAHVIDEQLRGFDAEWLATDEGLRRFDRLSTMANKTAGVIKALATSMRLTHQAIYQKDKVIPKPGRKLWQREKSEV